MILARDLLAAQADETISKRSPITSFTFTKNHVRDRQPPDDTTAFRRTIAPVDDVTLQCTHYTNRVG